MDQVKDLTTVVQREVEDYARGGTAKAVTYPISDTERHIYSVIIVSDYPRKYKSAVMVAARVIGDKVVIEEDITDRPLWEELVRAGIPREQIILTYAGEKLPNEEGKS
jgi:hypothetical protein